MVERNVKGIVVAWSRGVKELGNKFQRGVLIKEEKDEQWYNIENDSEQELMSIPVVYPKGSGMQFVQVQNGKYWNFKQGSLASFKVPDVPPNHTPKAELVRNPIDKDESILRQLCFKCATWAMQTNSEVKSKVMELAYEDSKDNFNGDEVLKTCWITPRRVAVFAKKLRRELENWDNINIDEKEEE